MKCGGTHTKMRQDQSTCTDEPRPIHNEEAAGPGKISIIVCRLKTQGTSNDALNTAFDGPTEQLMHR